MFEHCLHHSDGLMDIILYLNLGVSKYRGTPKWMVKIIENPINPWMIWGENPIFGNVQMFTIVPTSDAGFGSSASQDVNEGRLHVFEEREAQQFDQMMIPVDWPFLECTKNDVS